MSRKTSLNKTEMRKGMHTGERVQRKWEGWSGVGGEKRVWDLGTNQDDADVREKEDKRMYNPSKG